MAASPTLIGIAVFSAVKLAGYVGAGEFLNRGYSKLANSEMRPVSTLAFGMTVTVVGLIVGFCWMFIGLPLALTLSEMFPSLKDGGAIVLYSLLLLPVRAAEWHAMITFFFERRATSQDSRRLLKLAILGALWSGALDIPAVLAVWWTPGAISYG